MRPAEQGPARLPEDRSGEGALEIALTSEAAAIGRAIDRLVAACRVRWAWWPVGKPIEEDLRICLSEALGNVVEHAYGRRPGLPIFVRACREPGGIALVIRDHGHPPPPLLFEGPAPAPAIFGRPVAALPERGWGCVLIRALAHRAEVRRHGGWTVLRLCFRDA